MSEGHFLKNINIYLSVSEYLQLKEIMALSSISKEFFKLVAKSLLLRLKTQGIDIRQYCFDDEYQIYKLANYLFSKNVIIIPGIVNDLVEKGSFVKLQRSKILNGAIVKKFDLNSCYCVIQLEDGNCYIQYTKNTLPVIEKGGLMNRHLDSFVKLENVLKYSLGSQNIFYITSYYQMKIRFFSQLENPADELEMDLNFNFYKFKEPKVSIVDFYATEHFAVLCTKKGSLYLMNSINSLKPEDVLNGAFDVYKIDFGGKVKDVALSNNNLFILDDKETVYYIKINRADLVERNELYNLSGAPSHLTLQPKPYTVLKGKSIRKIHTNNRNFFIFEEINKCKKIEDFTVDDVKEFMQDIEIKYLDKTIKHNKIDGKFLLQMNEFDIERMFGLKLKSFSNMKLLDEIHTRKNVKKHKPRLYAFGTNSKKQFNISNHLSYLVEIDTPNFDTNEQIQSIVIGWFNTVIITDKNRSFISVNCVDIQTRERLSSGLEEEPILNNKGKPAKNQKKRKSKKAKVEKQQKKQKNFDNKKFEWFDFTTYITTYYKNFNKNSQLFQVNPFNKNFYVMYGEELENRKSHLKYFETCEEWLQYIKLNKNYDKNDLLFLNAKGNNYKTYKVVFACKSSIKHIKLVKKKSDNKILWSLSNKYFDTKAEI